MTNTTDFVDVYKIDLTTRLGREITSFVQEVNSLYAATTALLKKAGAHYATLSYGRDSFFIDGFVFDKSPSIFSLNWASRENGSYLPTSFWKKCQDFLYLKIPRPSFLPFGYSHMDVYATDEAAYLAMPRTLHNFDVLGNGTPLFSFMTKMGGIREITDNTPLTQEEFRAEAEKLGSTFSRLGERAAPATLPAPFYEKKYTYWNLTKPQGQETPSALPSNTELPPVV